MLRWQPGKKADSCDQDDEPSKEDRQPDELKVGQRVRIWPNRSAMTGSHFDSYIVVESDRKGDEDEIVDVWVRARDC